MAKLKAGVRTHDLHLTLLDGVLQQQYGEAILLTTPKLFYRNGKDEGQEIVGDTIPANKHIIVEYGVVESSLVLFLTPLLDMQAIVAPRILYGKKGVQNKVTLYAETIRSIPREGFGDALLIGL